MTEDVLFLDKHSFLESCYSERTLKYMVSSLLQILSYELYRCFYLMFKSFLMYNKASSYLCQQSSLLKKHLSRCGEFSVKLVGPAALSHSPGPDCTTNYTQYKPRLFPETIKEFLLYYMESSKYFCPQSLSDSSCSSWRYWSDNSRFTHLCIVWKLTNHSLAHKWGWRNFFPSKHSE